MPLLDDRQFSKITQRYNCDDDVLNQIREFIIATMIPDEDVILNRCVVTVVDLSKRFLTRSKPSRYLDVVFFIMYYQIAKTFIGEPVLEITYEAAEELTLEEFERRKETLPVEKMLREAKRIINPSYMASR